MRPGTFCNDVVGPVVLQLVSGTDICRRHVSDTYGFDLTSVLLVN